MVSASKIIARSGKPNYLGTRIPIPTKFNLKFLKNKLQNYRNRQIVEFLEFGFPLEFNGKTRTNKIPNNHAGARDFMPQIKKQLKKEVDLLACIGPFEQSPFGTDITTSPLNSVPKKDSTDRRLILNLSFTIGNMVNDGISKDIYQGIEEKLSLPFVDDLVYKIMQLGRHCLIFSRAL